MEDVKHHHILKDQNLIILSETWLSDLQTSTASMEYSLDNYEPKYCNVGNGKGITSYAKQIFSY